MSIFGWGVIIFVVVSAAIAFFFDWRRNRKQKKLIEIPKPASKESLKSKAKKEAEETKNLGADARTYEMKRKLRKLKKLFKEDKK